MPLASSSILNVLLVRIAVAYSETVISTWKTDYRTAKLVSDVSKNIFLCSNVMLWKHDNWTTLFVSYADWNELFTTKCFACGFPIEAGDRWVEAMNNNYHSQCFTCAVMFHSIQKIKDGTKWVNSILFQVCKKNLEGQSFLGKGGRPMCKSHVR